MIGGEADFLLNSVPESGNRGPVTLHSSMAERLPSPPPLPPKESLTKRYKLIWRVLLISNLALGGQSPTILGLLMFSACVSVFLLSNKFS